MCGIVGYIGKQSTEKIIMAGLDRLQYRGYDSAGIATIFDGKLQIEKEAGKLIELRETLQNSPIEGNIGIGHTRWATHGKPIKANAHPHSDCKSKLAIVHNGIIENYLELRQQLQNNGHKFRSETDTEVIAHLIEKAATENDQFVDAISQALKQLEGSFAIAIIHQKFPDRLFVAQNGSPLMVGIGNDENFIASDIPALIPNTRQIIQLSENQMAVVTSEKVKIQTLDGKAIEPKIDQVEWNAETIDRGNYPHFMLKEIHQQPDVLRKIQTTYVTNNREIDFGESFNFTKINRIMIQACGTSWHSALSGKHLIERYAKIPTEIEVSSEFRYRPISLDRETLLVSISQSGETADTLGGLRKVKNDENCNAKTLAICNVPSSTLANESDTLIETHAGIEIGVASTKAYTAQLAVLGLLAVKLGEIRKTITLSEKDRFLSSLQKVPVLMDGILRQSKPIERCAKKFSSAKAFIFIGRQMGYPSALEGALKLKELAYIHATGYPAGEFKHGPIALVEPNMPIVCIATKGELYPKIVSNIQEIRARDGLVIAIATEGDREIEMHAQEILHVPELAEELSPLLTAVPLQLLAYHAAVELGCNVDQPRNLAKSVTVE